MKKVEFDICSKLFDPQFGNMQIVGYGSDTDLYLGMNLNENINRTHY